MTQRLASLTNLRDLSAEELAAHLREQRGQLFQVRLQQTIGQVENHRQIRVIRKEIARTMTVQVQRGLASERGEAPVLAAAPILEATRRRGRRSAVAIEQTLVAPLPVAGPVQAEEMDAAEVPVLASDVDTLLAAEPSAGETEALDERADEEEGDVVEIVDAGGDDLGEEKPA